MKHIPSVSPGQVKKVLKAAGQAKKKAKKVRRCRAVVFKSCPNSALPGGLYCEAHEELRLPCRCLADDRCPAVIYHGPGHQSHTHCEVRGEHSVHEARYGSYDQLARWTGDKVFSGYFDEPPKDPGEDFCEEPEEEA